MGGLRTWLTLGRSERWAPLLVGQSPESRYFRGLPEEAVFLAQVETKEQNTTQVLEEAHAECVMELMAERKASGMFVTLDITLADFSSPDVYNQGGNMPYQSGKTEQVRKEI